MNDTDSELVEATVSLLQAAAAWLDVAGENSMPDRWPGSPADWAVDQAFERAADPGGYRPLVRVIANGALHSVGAGSADAAPAHRLRGAAEILSG
jgi:hypothetical protein